MDTSRACAVPRRADAEGGDRHPTGRRLTWRGIVGAEGPAEGRDGRLVPALQKVARRARSSRTSWRSAASAWPGCGPAESEQVHGRSPTQNFGAVMKAVGHRSSSDAHVKLSEPSGAAACCSALAIGAVLSSCMQSFPTIPGQNIGPAAFPGLLAALLALCALLLIVRGLRDARRRAWVALGAWVRSPRACAQLPADVGALRVLHRAGRSGWASSSAASLLLGAMFWRCACARPDRCRWRSSSRSSSTRSSTSCCACRCRGAC